MNTVVSENQPKKYNFYHFKIKIKEDCLMFTVDKPEITTFVNFCIDYADTLDEFYLGDKTVRRTGLEHMALIDVSKLALKMNKDKNKKDEIPNMDILRRELQYIIQHPNIFIPKKKNIGNLFKMLDNKFASTK